MATARGVSRSGTNALSLQFIVVTLGITWLFWWAAAFVEQGVLSLPVPTFFLVTAGAFGPFVTALILTAREEGRAGVLRLLGRVVRWRVAPRWWAIVLLGPLLATLAGMGIQVILGGTPPDAMSLAESTLMALVTALYMVFLVALGEEVGWRGFLLPALQTNYNALWSSVIVGLVWAVWHLPLFFNPAMSYSRTPFALFAVYLIFFAILLTWVYNSSRGSVLLVILFHAMMNGSNELWKSSPDLQQMRLASASDAQVLVYSIMAAVLAALAVIVVMAVGQTDLSSERRQTLESSEGEP